MPAQLVVTSATDDGSAGTLRSIIGISNTNGEADTVTFDPAVTSITLSKGQLTISEGNNLTIDGGSAVTINGGAASSTTNRIFNLTPTGQPTITIKGITLAKGNTIGDGGAINCGFTSTASQLTLFNCNLVGNTITGSGGAVYITKGRLSVTDCTFDHNSAGSTGYPLPAGGAIFASGDVTVTLNKTTVSNNTAPSDGGAQGGGIFAYECHIDLTDCSILNNTAPNSYGGGLEIYESVATLTNCTVAGNSAGLDSLGGAGGLDLYGDSTTTLTNCTIANNSAFSAGGIVIDGPTIIRNCTIAGNSALYYGSGIYAYSGTVTSLDSSIVANNRGGWGNEDIMFGQFKGNNNLIGNVSQSTLTGTNNLTGKDPGLLPLGDYGGPTLTMALRYNSIAIDKGSNPANLQYDQRGQPRASPTGSPDIGAVEGSVAVPFVAKVATLPNITTSGGTAYKFTVTYDGPNSVDPSSLDVADINVSGPVPVGPVSVTGITISGNQVKATYQFTPPGGSWDQFDIGTYSVNLVVDEVWDQAQPAQFVPPQLMGTFKQQIAGNYVVDSIEDTVDGNYGPGQFTLREAVQWGNVFPTTGDTISFDPIVFSTSKTIVLNSELTVSGLAVVMGPGANLLTLSGNGANRIFNASQAAMTVSGLTLANGRANYVSGDTSSGNGGAIYAQSITLVDCVLIDNSAKFRGGAIYASYSLSLTRSTILNNTSSSGGGVYGWRATVTLENSTISGNTASYGGGLNLDDDGDLIARNSTIANNSATISGGAIYGYLSPYSSATINVTLSSTIVAKNVSANSPDFFFTEAVNVAGDNNLIGVADTGNITFTGANNQTGTTASPLDPMLGPVAYHGGTTQTMSLLPGSPCIDAGSVIAGITTDQRGYVRSYGSAPDIGAFESQPPHITSIIINNGLQQRARVTNVTVNFDSKVSILSTAFQLQRQNDGQLVDLASQIIVDEPTTSVSLSFSGALTEFGSLKDGRYMLTVFGTQVSNFVGSLDGNNDGITGDNYVLVGTPANGLFRLFGDSNGDGRVDTTDLTPYRTAVGIASTTFDFNNDGVVNSPDFTEFRKRFGLMI